MAEHYLRKELYERVRAGDDVFEWLKEGSLDGVWFWDLENPENEWMSPRLKEVFGYEDHEVPNTSAWWQENIFPDDLPGILDMFDRHVKYGEPYDQVVRYRHKDGSTVWVRCRGLVLKDQSGRPVRMLGAHTDVTALKLAEEGRRLALEAANLGTWNWFIQSGEIDWSDECYRLFGVPTDEMLNFERFLALLHPEDREQTSTLVQQAVESGEPFSTEYRVVWQDGSVHWLAAMGTCWHDHDGTPRRMEGVVQGIDARKHAERLLRDSEQRLTQAQDIGGIGMFDWNIRDDEATCNDRYFELYDFPKQTSTPSQEDWLETIHPADRDRALEELSDALTSGAVYDSQYRTVCGDGSIRWLHCRARVHTDKDGRPERMIGSVIDNTERERRVEKLRRSEHMLARSNDELRQFAYVASHDLQEPLRMVTSYLQLLERRYAGQLDDEADEFIAFAVDGAQRMKTLIDDLLSLSRVDTTGKPLRATDMEQVLDHVLDDLSVSIEEIGARVTREELPAVSGDAGQLAQLLQNLIGNAIKYRDAQAPEIHIAAERVADADGDVPDLCRQSDWVISVCDNGIGIEAGHEQDVFQIFRRLHTRDEFSGTGIGLSICKKIVERHGGQIWYEPNDRGGSTFRFTVGDAERRDFDLAVPAA